jgi:hypothetical protein
MRKFLWFSLLVWLPYGLFCLFRPDFLATAAGVTFTSATGSTEIRAMYGGLQAGIGLLSGLALLRRDLVRPTLLMLAFLCGGLGIARVAGVLMDQSLSAYTVSGLAFEFTFLTLAVVFLGRLEDAGAA